MARPRLSQFNYSAFSGSPEATRFYQRKYVSYFTKGDTVLDVGCGEGDFLELLKDAGIEAIGLERSELMLSKLQKKTLSVVQGDAREFLKGKADTYNGIFCAHFIEHLTPDEALGFLGDAFDALKPGGILIVITPNLGSIEVMSERFWLDLTHTRPYPLPLLKEMAHFAGFEIVASGFDRDTGRSESRLDPRYLLKKLRFGEYYARGDSFMIARKRQ
ncbi:MAG: class I SAM-dependent methyltransferase [Candidatus Eisenbacteria bacterium]|nr:class I SAM-dependent methyltransferase [Candidatus Eisenbacteria bacterium]